MLPPHETVTFQLHQILRPPRKKTLMIDPRHTCNVQYNARSIKTYLQPSPNIAILCSTLFFCSLFSTLLSLLFFTLLFSTLLHSMLLYSTILFFNSTLLFSTLPFGLSSIFLYYSLLYCSLLFVKLCNSEVSHPNFLWLVLHLYLFYVYIYRHTYIHTFTCAYIHIYSHISSAASTSCTHTTGEVILQTHYHSTIATTTHTTGGGVLYLQTQNHGGMFLGMLAYICRNTFIQYTTLFSIYRSKKFQSTKLPQRPTFMSSLNFTRSHKTPTSEWIMGSDGQPAAALVFKEGQVIGKYLFPIDLLTTWINITVFCLLQWSYTILVWIDIVSSQKCFNFSLCSKTTN